MHGTTEMDVQLTPRGGKLFFQCCGRLIPAFLAAVFLALSAWTWRKWPDLLIDFGRELYVPWQILEGKVLYRDIAYLNGPLSPYVNALWFSIFGVSLTTLIMVNLTIAGALTAAIYAFLKRHCDRLTATCSCLLFLCVFAFAHFTFTGNCNFVCPYSHELTHGIALSIFMIFLLSGAVNHRGLSRPVASGACLGLIFLTKAEVFLAGLAVVLAAILLSIGSEPKTGRRRAAIACSFLAGALPPIALFFAYLCRFMPAYDALRGIAGTWPNLHAAFGLGGGFYRQSMGIITPWPQAAAMGRSLAGLSLFVGAIVVWSLDTKKTAGRILAMLSAAGLLALSLLIRKSPVPWLLVPEPLPVVAFLGGAILLIYCVENRHEAEVLASLAPLCLWTVFAFSILGKILLNPRFYHFGFALTMPATIFLVVLLTWFLPRLVSLLHGREKVFRLIVVLFLISDLVYFVLQSNIAYSKKTYAVGSGKNLILTYEASFDPRGPAVNHLLERIQRTFPPRADFVVLPEGVMINYLTRRPNPTPYINFMPTELAAFGEATILQSIEAHPPDFVILLEKDTTEYNVGPFGEDPTYGRLIMDWVGRNYVNTWQNGAPALMSKDFEVQLLKRKTSTNESSQ